jgi:translation initiation factor 4E
MTRTSDIALACEWSFFLFFRQQGSDASDHYEDNIHLLGSFSTIPGFWALYSHLRKPNDLEPPTDYHLFRKGIRAIWEDADNVNGGKWMIRLRKGLISYYWEQLIMALIGEQFPADVLGAVASVRVQEDIISLWNRSGSDSEVTHQICCRICEALELPAETRLEYKKHGESVKDGSSYRNTVIYQAGANEPFEVQQPPISHQPKWGKK